MPSDKDSLPPGGPTMQLDAIVDDLEDMGLAPDLGHMVSAPPPLPPKKAGTSVWVIGIMVVVIATGLGLGVGLFVLGSRSGEPAQADSAEPAPPSPSADSTGAQAEPEADPAPEAEHNIVSLDEIVFDDAVDAPEGQGSADEEEELPSE